MADGGVAFNPLLYATQSLIPGVTGGTWDFTYWSTTNSSGQTAGLNFDGIDNGAESFMGTAGNAMTWPRAVGKLVGSFKVNVSTNLTA